MNEVETFGVDEKSELWDRGPDLRKVPDGETRSPGPSGVCGEVGLHAVLVCLSVHEFPLKKSRTIQVSTFCSLRFPQ